MFTIVDVKGDPVTVEPGKLVVTANKTVAYRTARWLATKNNITVKVVDALDWHGSYVPVDWCPRCTPDHNCLAMTAYEEMEKDYYDERF